MVGIQYLPYQQVDKKKWDGCIDRAGNGLVYAYSFYLDNMAHCWDALVLNDYEIVMPLTWKKKYGIMYLYQPFCTAALGLFGNDINGEMVKEFLKVIPAKFKYWDIYLNYENVYSLNAFKLYKRTNYILPLNAPYEKLFAAFSTNLKRNIKKAAKLECCVSYDINVQDVVTLAKKQGKDYSNAGEKDYRHLQTLYQHLHAQGKATCYGVYSASGELLASCVWFFSHRRAYYILAGNHPAGKTAGASHALINQFIKDNAGEDILLDFEGSDVPTLASFYRSFGASVEIYGGLKLNKLPGVLKLFKQ
ncbi:MAG: GNAT family N-acetyltransferase [Ferruginibacter sp.]